MTMSHHGVLGLSLHPHSRYNKLKEATGAMKLELTDLRRVCEETHGIAWDDVSYGQIKQDRTGFKQLSFRTRILKKEPVTPCTHSKKRERERQTQTDR